MTYPEGASKMTASEWLSEIKRYQEDEKVSAWTKACKSIRKVYCGKVDARENSAPKFNILWSNVEVLRPSLYAQVPKPVVSRRYDDRDPVGRVASSVLQRTLEYEADFDDFDGAMSAAVQDLLLDGRGVARVRYAPEFGMVPQGIDPVTGQPAMVERITDQTTEVEFVGREDFAHDLARRWPDVRWVAFATYIGRDDAAAQFPDTYDKIKFDVSVQDDDDGREARGKSDAFAQARVWEIWCKTTKTVYWVSPSTPDLMLKEAPDPLRIPDFFPCPKPCLGTLTTDSLVPVPDFEQYRDQVRELNEIVGKINEMVDKCRLAGVYNAEMPELANALRSGLDMTPVTNWAAFAQAGGMKGAVDFFPIEAIVASLMQLYDAEEKAKRRIYEITGLSDIIRGSSVASETATAQRIKGQYASIRLRDRQAEVSRFARDLFRLISSVACVHYQDETLLRVAAVAGMPEAQEPDGQALVMEAFKLLRDEFERSFRVDIEADSTIRADEDAEKAARSEFLTAAGGFMREALPVAQANPAMAPLLGKMLLFGVRGFPKARELESAFEQAIDASESAAAQPQPMPQMPGPQPMPQGVTNA